MPSRIATSLLVLVLCVPLIGLTPGAAYADIYFGAGGSWDSRDCWAQVIQFSATPVTFLDNNTGLPTPIVASSNYLSAPPVLGAEFALYGPDLNFWSAYWELHYGQVPWVSFDPDKLVQDVVVYQEETPGSLRWDAQAWFKDITLPVGHYSFYVHAQSVTAPDQNPGIHFGAGAFIRAQFDVNEGTPAATPELPAGALTLISALPLSLVFRRRRRA